MKTIAIIAECNPLHNGHAWLFREARRRSGADFLIVLLSGDYVQRGEPAILDKYLRTEMVLEAGADLVLELPVVFATGSAQRFATGAVALLDRLGVVNELWFGSETGRIEPFLRGADVLAEEPDSFRKNLKTALAQGYSMPAARAHALALEPGIGDDVLDLLRHPNDSLGLTYLLALRKCKSRIIPRTLPRQSVLEDPSDDVVREASSATALRKHLLTVSPEDALPILRDAVPEEILPFYEKGLSQQSVLSFDDFSMQLYYALQMAFRNESPRTDYLDLPEELAQRIRHFLFEYRSASQFAMLLKTKERTLSQIRRALLHILLQITAEQYPDALQADRLRMLGHGPCDPLFTEIKKTGQLSLFAGGATLQESFYATDLFASRLYESVCAHKHGTFFRPEESRSLCLRT